MKTRARVSVTEVRAYGMRELRTQYNKNVMLGLLAAALIHMAVIWAAYLSTRNSTVPTSGTTPPPISIDNGWNFGKHVTEVAIRVASGGVKATMGIPIPVPDLEITPEKTIATQGELASGSTGLGSSTGLINPGSGVETGNNGTELNISDPPMDEFQPVEKLPVPVKLAMPEYPEIARRAGVEGTVWVKALVTKEGKVKRAVVQKSDADVFNEVAIAAAMQYVFTPAIMNSGPVAVWASIPFRFKLNR